MVPSDPWGNPYVYRSPGQHGTYDIISYGADGQEGGTGTAADITNWSADRLDGQAGFTLVEIICVVAIIAILAAIAVARLSARHLAPAARRHMPSRPRRC